MGAHGPRRRAEVGPVLTAGDHDPNAFGTRSFHGRRKGKQLRPGQQRLIDELLPRVAVAGGSAPLAPAGLFGRPVDRIVLEIGFGGGEHIAALARAEPGSGFIGCEPFLNGTAKLLAAIERDRLDNLRLWPDDATRLIARLPDRCLDGVYLLYPDPWPKRRQRKRRFVSDETLASLARVMRSGAELRFATDIDDYAGWTLVRAFRSADLVWTGSRCRDWQAPWAGWDATRYEAKAVREKRASSYITLRRS